MHELNSRHFDVTIIGGGAAGLMCAMTAAQRGRRVLVLEGSNKLGKKILMSGGGRCNFTNLDVSAENFVSANPHFCKSALSRYTPWDFITLADRHGIAWHERKHGQLFCDVSSRLILNMLLDECAGFGVKVHTHCSIASVTACNAEGANFALATDAGYYTTTSLVIATGGLSIPKMGASGFGYAIARQFGINVLPTRAGLVPLVFSEPVLGMCSRLAGVAVDCKLRLEPDPEVRPAGDARFGEALLFTHRGVSGPAVLQISNYWEPGTALRVDFLPAHDAAAWLRENKAARPRTALKTLLHEKLPRNLVAELAQLWWHDAQDKALANWSDADLAQVAAQLQRCVFKPAGTEGYRTAEVTLGGVDTAELSSKTMESKRHPGLYFIGEVVDVTGQLGGYNFQWAWASGHAAGSHA